MRSSLCVKRPPPGRPVLLANDFEDALVEDEFHDSVLEQVSHAKQFDDAHEDIPYEDPMCSYGRQQSSGRHADTCGQRKRATTLHTPNMHNLSTGSSSHASSVCYQLHIILWFNC